jgi:hypothetical protein
VCQDYSDRTEKAAAYEILFYKLQELDIEANRESVIRRINNIRSS